jgi:hypothetical protein
MTPEEFANKMRDIIVEWEGDEEYCHSAMDCCMCDLLRELGYGEGIDIFNHQPKWYA